MKIICIGRNYAEHIAELQHERPDAPVVFMKPDTALLRGNEPFYYPDFSQEIHHEVELVLRISKQGKYIDAKYASNYYDQLGLGIDFTARDIQMRAKAKGLPWETAKAFNDSAPVSTFVPITHYQDIQNINFSLKVNGELRQSGNTSHMIWNFNELVSYVSRFFLLKTGDLLFTGTPAGVAEVKIGDRLEGFIESDKFLDFEIR